MTTADDDLNSLGEENLTAELEARFGFRADPLAMEMPFFPDASRHHALETLRHLCGFGDLALVLTGASGTGKSRLLAELVRSESSRLDFHKLPPEALRTTQTLSNALISLAYRGLESSEGARDAVYGFFRWSETRARKGRRMVLLFDDADRVPADVLRLLLGAYQAADRVSAAAVVFSGSDELVSLLGLSGDSAGVYQIHLRPLSAGEIASYLEPRIHKAGGDLKALLSPQRLAALHRLSHGSFSALRRVAPSVWLDKAPAEVRQSSRFHWVVNARWPAVALVLLAASWWLVSQQYDASVEREQAQPMPEPVRKSVTIGPESPDIPSVDQPEPVAAEPELPPEPVKPEPVPEPEPEPEPEPLSFVPQKPASFLPLVEVRASNGWTIQVIAGNQEQTVVNVIEQHESELAIRYTVTQRQGKDWHVGFFGDFATKADAREAIEQLPGALRRQSPWIRKRSGF